jgi:hypothetical protein
VPLTCPDDGARCTADACDPIQGCTHTSIPGCCASDADCQDLTVCNGIEHCVAGDCVPGTPLVCDDGNACNGQETCDPVLGCQAGTALSQTNPYSYEAIVCAINQIDAYVRTAPVAGLGGTLRVTSLEQTLVRIKRNFGYQSPRGDGLTERSTVNPRGVIKLLRQMGRRLDAAIRRRVVTVAVAGPLRDLVGQTLTQVQHYQLGATQPPS